MVQIVKKIFLKIHFLFLRLKIRKLSPSIACQILPDDKVEHPGEPAFSQQYSSYVTEISAPVMAASYECLRFMITLCHRFAFKKILDFGSGFSSYAFRQYALSDKSIQVWSVDDNHSWLQKTAQYLNSRKVDAGNLVMLDDFIAGNGSHFDLIFFDLNFVEVRKNYIGLVLDRCKPGGMIIFDDVHKPDFMYEVLRQTSQFNLRLYDIKSFTLDRFGRFALLGIKQS